MAQQQGPMEKVGLVFLPMPAVGHLIPMVELAKRIPHLHPHRFAITILSIPPMAPTPVLRPYISSLAASSLPISIRHLPPVDPPVISTSTNPLVYICAYLDLYKPIVKSELQTIAAASPVPLAAIVLDFFCTGMIDVGYELGIAPYIFIPCCAAMLGLTLHMPTLDDLQLSEEDGMEGAQGKSMAFPGFQLPLPLLALPETMLLRNDSAHDLLIGIGSRLLKAKGIIINTFAELEPSVLKALEVGLYVPDHPTPPVYPVGPIIFVDGDQDGSIGEGQNHECIRWLDEQPQGSVVFICFGSMGCFDPVQTGEIALGLERSRHRFLWVLRSPAPPESTRNLRRSVDAVLDEVLPEGFVGRTRGRGMVWPSFAPQKQILGHAAVGGFVTHCGWNSSLEGVWFGVPMGAWPQHAEQHLNAHKMAREIGVAMEVWNDRTRGSVATADDVENGVRCLMGEECREVRMKVKEMRERGRKALEEGGSSYQSLWRLVAEMNQTGRPDKCPL